MCADEIEKLFLDKWSHTRNKETKKLSKDLIFTGKDDGPTIEEIIISERFIYEKDRKGFVWLGSRDEAVKWLRSLDNKKS